MHAIVNHYVMTLFVCIGIGAVLFVPALVIARLHENYVNWANERHYQKQLEKIRSS